MLSPELDVLRNKELTFWCHLSLNYEWLDKIKRIKALWHNWWWNYSCFLRIDTSENKEEYDKDYWHCLIKEIKDWRYNTIWHPLTRWRIEYLVTNHKASPDENKDLLYRICINKILDIFTFNNKLFDQTELERMQHDKWNELYPLLVEFSTYFKHE